MVHLAIIFQAIDNMAAMVTPVAAMAIVVTIDNND
jgi:hypothetical protein